MLEGIKHKAVAMTLALSMTAAPVWGSAFAASGFASDQPEKPVASSYTDNYKIEEYNKKVDEYNKAAGEYNLSVDKEYEAAVEETNSRNAEIAQQNEAELDRVRTAQENNERAIKEAEEANARIDAENAAEEARVNEHNSNEDAKVKASEEARKAAEEANEAAIAHNEKVDKYEADKAQYDKDYAQYQKDLTMEQRIKAAGYASVEQYNDMINTYYNIPAAKSLIGNANANVVTVKDTYKVTEAAEKTGAKVSVRIEHIFEGTDVSYTEDFEIDRNDILNLKSIAALGNATEEGYASLYYKTDDSHAQGYWVPYVEFGYNAKYVKSIWDCGTAYEVSYKDGKNHAYDKEEIVASYYYTWIPLKSYKTYNVPSAPVEPENPGERMELTEVPEIYTPNYEKFEKKPYVEVVLEEIGEANIMEMIGSPEKDAYVALLSHMDLFKMPEEVVPAAAVVNTTPAAAEKTVSAVPAQEAETALIAEQEVPMAAPSGAAQTVIEDNVTPLAAGSDWALLNLIMTIVTGIISAILMIGYFGKKEEEENEDESEDGNVKRKGFVRLASLIPAAGALITFVITENMHNPMVLTDRWTIVMAVFLIIQAAVALIAKKSKDDKDGHEMTEEMNAQM